MSIFIDPTGHSTYGLALCARCSRKFPEDELRPDPNSPGLMVCEEDCDEYDPYRLPARQTERINLEFVRPDLPLDVPVITEVRGVRVTQTDNDRITEDAGVRITQGIP